MVPLSLHASHGYQTVRHFKPNFGTGGVVGAVMVGVGGYGGWSAPYGGLASSQLIN